MTWGFVGHCKDFDLGTRWAATGVLARKSNII